MVERQAERMEKKTSLKKDNAFKEIDRRTASLNKLIERINSFKRLTSEQKATLVAEVQAESSSLSNLRASIEADTDLKTLSEHKKTIIDDYRIYALFLPKITIIANADKILELAQLMKAKTTDITALAKISGATTKAQMAIDTVITLTPTEYPGNKSSLESARKNLKEARADLNAVRPLLK